MSRQHRICGLIRTSGLVFEIQRTGGGGPYTLRTITIPDGDYYLADDGAADDLVHVIEGLVTAYAELATFTMSTLADGIAHVAMGTSITATITWTAAGEALRDLLRYSGATLDLTDVAVEGARVCATTHYPTYGLSIDDEAAYALGRQVVMADGHLEADDWGSAEERTIRWNYFGPARSVDYTEYRELRELWDAVVVHSYPLRLYPDRTIITAYDALTAPWGYQTWVAIGPPRWAPQRVIPGVSVAYSAEWTLRLYVP